MWLLGHSALASVSSKCSIIRIGCFMFDSSQIRSRIVNKIVSTSAIVLLISAVGTSVQQLKKEAQASRTASHHFQGMQDAKAPLKLANDADTWQEITTLLVGLSVLLWMLAVLIGNRSITLIELPLLGIVVLLQFILV